MASFKKEYFLIKTNYSHYYAEVWHQYPNIDKVYIGGRKRCVLFSIYLDEADPNIDGIGYDETCNVAGDMRRGKGTRHMILSAFAFIKDLYANTHVSQVFLLKDTSKIACSGYDMYLSHYYLAHYGKTWYEKHLGAAPVESKDTYKRGVLQFQEVLKTKPDVLKDVKSKQRYSVLTREYNKYVCLEDFIASTKDSDCIVYKDWLDKLIEKYIPNILTMEWSVDASVLEVPSIEIVRQGEHRPKDMFIHAGGANNTPWMVSNGLP